MIGLDRQYRFRGGRSCGSGPVSACREWTIGQIIRTIRALSGADGHDGGQRRGHSVGMVLRMSADNRSAVVRIGARRAVNERLRTVVARVAYYTLYRSANSANA